MFKKKVKLPAQKPVKVKKAGGDKKWLMWGLIGFTGILLVTAVVLFFQLKEPVAPPAPKPRPKASPVLPSVKQVTDEGVCEVAFSVVEPSPSPSPSPSVSPNPSPSPSPSVSPSPSPSPPAIACFDQCSEDTDCTGDLRCQDVAGVDRCVNAECPNDIDCSCPGASPSLSPSSPPKGAPDPSPVPSPRVEDPALPEAGVSAPAVLGVSAGLLLVIFGLLF